MAKTVKRFWQRQNKEGIWDFGIEYTDGTAKTANDAQIQSMWWHWCMAKDAKKYHKDGATIFEYENR